MDENDLIDLLQQFAESSDPEGVLAGRLSTDQIAPPPPTVVGLGTEYLTGLVKLEKQILILLDIEKVLGESERDALAAAVTK